MSEVVSIHVVSSLSLNIRRDCLSYLVAHLHRLSYLLRCIKEKINRDSLTVNLRKLMLTSRCANMMHHHNHQQLARQKIVTLLDSPRSQLLMRHHYGWRLQAGKRRVVYMGWGQKHTLSLVPIICCHHRHHLHIRRPSHLLTKFNKLLAQLYNH